MMIRYMAGISALLLSTAIWALLPGATTPGAINPAVTQANIKQTICAPGWTRQVRPSEEWSESLKKNLLDQDYSDTPLRDFELDHRVPLEAGGCPTCVTNLWLEPWRDPDRHTCEPNVMLDAACKDQLENEVHRRICVGVMTLQQGQAVFLGDWTAVYKTMIRGTPDDDDD